MSGVRARRFEPDETWRATNCMESAVALRNTKADERLCRIVERLATARV